MAVRNVPGTYRRRALTAEEMRTAPAVGSRWRSRWRCRNARVRTVAGLYVRQDRATGAEEIMVRFAPWGNERLEDVRRRMIRA